MGLIPREKHNDVSINWYTSAVVDIAFDFYPPSHTVNPNPNPNRLDLDFGASFSFLGGHSS